MKFVGPVDVRSLNTPSGAGNTIPAPSYLNSDLLKSDPVIYIMTWSYDVRGGSPLHPLLIRYPRWTRNCVTRLTLI